MVPLVFISSTIEDLHYLRDVVRDAIIELAYHPVMSEYGEVAYVPEESAADSCYLSVRECQIAVIIIGRRYGSLDENGLSVTHNEFRAARTQGIPTICLVEPEVMSYRKIYNANAGDLVCPGMENPSQTFAFVDEITTARTNNAILPFNSGPTARSLIKTQIAHWVGQMLRRGLDPMTSDIKDILTEMKTLRYDLDTSTATKKKAPVNFMRALRFLLDQQAETYRQIVEKLCGTLEDGVPTILESATFSEFVKKTTGQEPDVVPINTLAEAKYFIQKSQGEFLFSHYGGAEQIPDWPVTLLVITRDPKRVLANEPTLQDLEKLHKQIQSVAHELSA